MIGIIIGLVVMLADAFVLWCCCRMAGIADRADAEWIQKEMKGKEHE